MVVKDIFKGIDDVNKILISNGGENAIDKTFFYLSGVKGGLFENSSIVATRDSVKMFIFPLEREGVKGTENEVVVCTSRADMREKVAKELSHESEIGVNLSALTVSMFKDIEESNPGIRFNDIAKNIDRARSIKSPEEIRKIRVAAKISADVYESFLDGLKEGMTETQAAAMLVSLMMAEGASQPAFTSIVGFGPNSAIPHHDPGDRKLKKGDFVLIDYGAQFERYCADRTRTAVFGRAEEKQKEMYDVVYRAESACISMIRDGENGRLVNQKAHDIIDSTEYEGRLIHGIGHGVGLYVHDHTALGKEDFELMQDMVITIEPGIYIPDYGGVRIEDDLIVKKNGCEAITGKTPKELIEVS